MHYACYIDFTTMTRVETTAPCVTTPTSIEENVNAVKVDLYPNPALDNINVSYSLNESEATTVSIVNSVGQVINTIQIGETQDASKTISINNLQSGTYQLIIRGDKTNIIRKFNKL